MTPAAAPTAIEPKKERSFRASSKAVEFRPLEVVVQDNNINRAISLLKRKMATEGIYKELRKRRFFEKPSERRKRKQREAERRRKKLMRGGGGRRRD